MTAITTLTRTSVGKKVAMASTGLLLVGWLVLHMIGNLLVFAGQAHFNRYATFIQSGFGVEPGLLWLMRLLLLAALAVHVGSAVALKRRNVGARPVAYQGGRVDRETNAAARSMMTGGLVLLAFIGFHLAHFTVGTFSDDAIQHGTFVHGDAYRNLVIGLQNHVVGVIYVLAQLALFAHLLHGVESAFQTLGLGDPRWDAWKVGLGRWVPGLILAGNLLVALACMFGVGVIVDRPDLSWTPPAH